MRLAGFYCALIVCSFCCNQIALAQQATTSQDVRHGIAQLEQLLEDRPDMQGIFPAGSPVNVWIDDAFANRAGRRVYWDNREPISGLPAQYTGSANGAPAAIRITGKTEVLPLDKYSHLIFQLQSAKGINDMHKLCSLAMSDRLNAQEFAERMVLLQFHALVETQAFVKANRFVQLATDGNVFTNGVLSTQNDGEAYLKEMRALPPGDGNELTRQKDWYESIAKQQNASP